MVTAVIDGDIVAAARERVALMLERSPQAYAAAKRLLWLAANVDLESGMVAEGLAQSLLIGTDGAQAGGRGGAMATVISNSTARRRRSRRTRTSRRPRC